jgi:sugar phosphate isomerase/epimerase
MQGTWERLALRSTLSTKPSKGDEMKLGISAFAWTAKFTEGHLTLLGGLREHQFRGLEIPMFDPLALPAASMRRAFEANAMDCTVCAILPIGINPISPDASIRKQSLTHLMQCVETTAAMGSRGLRELSDPRRKSTPSTSFGSSTSRKTLREEHNCVVR